MQFADQMGELSAGMQSFGLTEYESRLYVALLSNGPSTVNHLQFSSGVPRTKVYQVAQQLVKKGVAKEREGKPVRFEANPPEVFHSVVAEREKSVRHLKKVLGSLKKLRERNMLPHDVVEERYLSLGSQSILMKLKESILKAQSGIRCVVDSWGLHLIQECAEELEAVCAQDVEVMVISSVPPTLPDLRFASAKMKIRYGKHLVGKSSFVIDSTELILVNSQTGRGYQFMLSELRSIMGEELFNEYWKSSTGAKAIMATSVFESLPFLVDTPLVNRLFIEAVARAVGDDRLVGSIGQEFLSLLEERVSPKLRQEPFDGAVKLILALMEEELGEETSVEYDPLTRIVRMELPDSQDGTPVSAWYFALSGLLRRNGVSSDVLHDAAFPEARTRIIQKKFAAPQ